MKCMKIIPVWDMRKKTALRASLAVRRLKNEECIMAFSRDGKIARIVDCNEGILDYPAPQGTTFDSHAVVDMVARGWGVVIGTGIGRKVRHRKAS